MVCISEHYTVFRIFSQASSLWARRHAWNWELRSIDAFGGIRLRATVWRLQEAPLVVPVRAAECFTVAGIGFATVYLTVVVHIFPEDRTRDLWHALALAHGISETHHFARLGAAVTGAIAIAESVAVGVTHECTCFGHFDLAVHILIFAAVAEAILVRIALQRIRLRFIDFDTINDAVSVRIWIIGIGALFVFTRVVYMITVVIDRDREDDRTHDIARLSSMKNFGDGCQFFRRFRSRSSEDVLEIIVGRNRSRYLHLSFAKRVEILAVIHLFSDVSLRLICYFVAAETVAPVTLFVRFGPTQECDPRNARPLRHGENNVRVRGSRKSVDGAICFVALCWNHPSFHWWRESACERHGSLVAEECRTGHDNGTPEEGECRVLQRLDDVGIWTHRNIIP